jgi:glutamine synthetase type III
MPEFELLNEEINETKTKKAFNSKNFWHHQNSVAAKFRKLTGLNFKSVKRTVNMFAPDVACDEIPSLVIECKLRNERNPAQHEIEKLFEEAVSKYGKDLILVIKHKGNEKYYIRIDYKLDPYLISAPLTMLKVMILEKVKGVKNAV